MSCMDISKQIKKERQRQNLTKYKVAKLMGTSQTYYNNLETEGFSPSLDMMKRVCKALDISITIHPDTITIKGNRK